MARKYTEADIQKIYEGACEKSGMYDVQLVLLDNPIDIGRGMQADVTLFSESLGGPLELHANKTFLSKLKPDVIEFNFCHELNHAKNNDHERRGAVGKTVGTLNKGVKIASGVAATAAILTPLSNIIIPAALFMIPVSNALANAITSKFLRQQEYGADTGAVADTGNLDAAVEYYEDLKLYESSRVLGGIFDSHPRLQERIDHIKSHFSSAVTAQKSEVGLEPPVQENA